MNKSNMTTNNLTVSRKTKKPVPTNVLSEWKLKNYNTSQYELARMTGLSRPTISEVIHSGEATTEVFNKLAEAYDKIELPA